MHRSAPVSVLQICDSIDGLAGGGLGPVHPFWSQAGLVYFIVILMLPALLDSAPAILSTLPYLTQSSHMLLYFIQLFACSAWKPPLYWA